MARSYWLVLLGRSGYWDVHCDDGSSRSCRRSKQQSRVRYAARRQCLWRDQVRHALLTRISSWTGFDWILHHRILFGIFILVIPLKTDMFAEVLSVLLCTVCWLSLVVIDAPLTFGRRDFLSCSCCQRLTSRKQWENILTCRKYSKRKPSKHSHFLSLQVILFVYIICTPCLKKVPTF